MKTLQTPLSTKITVDLAQWLNEYSKETEKTKSGIIQEALEDYRRKVDPAAQ
jgi:predicted DNA-binding protein